MNEEARNKIIRARVAMIMRQPFFGSLALRLILAEDDTLNPQTLATDNKTLFYHPEWVMKNELDVVMAGVGHEVGHCVFDHVGRRGGRDPMRWNMACDYVVNAVLKACDFTIQPDWLYSPKFENQSADQIYEQLAKGESSAKKGNRVFDVHFDKCAESLDPAVDKNDWEIAAIQAANAAKNQGALPGALQRFIDTIINPKVDWRAVMRRFMTDAAREDYSYARMNRKFVSLGIYLPGLYSEAMGEVVGTIDTSGSITKPIFDAFIGEFDDLHARLRPSRLTIIQCDSAIGKIDHFEPYDQFKVEAIGGGGTDFNPPFNWVRDEGITPKAFVYLTDGYGSFPKEAPSYPVLWIMTTEVVPPFGEYVRIEL